MSQFFLNTASGPIPPSLLATITGDTGGPVSPQGNNINIIGGQSSVNNTIGIAVNGNNGTATETVTLTNRFTGSTTTTDGTTSQSLILFPLGLIAGTYLIDIQTVAYNITDGLSFGFRSFRTIRTTGASAVTISAAPGIISEESTMINVLVQSGVTGNNLTQRVTGLAGKTIDWYALLTYVFIS